MFLTASATTQKRIEPILDNKKEGFTPPTKTRLLIITCGILPQRFHVVFDVQQSTILRSVNHFV